MKLLVILPRFPYPLEKGDKLRAYHFIRTLSSANEIHLFALSHTPVSQQAIDEMEKYCASVHVQRLSPFIGLLHALKNLFTVRSLQIGYWYSRRARRACLSYARSVKPDIVLSQMIRTIRYASHLPMPKVLDLQDALSMNIERRMANSRGFKYFLLHYEFKMLRSAEFNACDIFDRLTIISDTDADAIPQHRGTQIDIIRNGVDFDYFAPLPMPKRTDVVFCGNMQYAPNIDASKYLVEEIMPIVWRTHPNVSVVIAGATPKPAVRQLACDRVHITGSVDDIRPYYAQSQVFIAPMRIGSGLQNKLLEAMSMGIPCITTPLANASLGAQSGTEIQIGNDAAQLASAIVRLLDDQGLRQRQADAASRFVHSHYSWDAVGATLQQVIEQAAISHQSVGKTSTK